ncbi:hypothetical protein PAF15_06110 [Weissella koreensis]|uniref:hypothetical protein n=1 Tax=Weissella koreensis TaxID=165096 RepID=UPI0022BA1D9D|nr:hypothetical protein [Weissella koreensis]MCZ9311516.1 hypothetical protein [Weissella koreensis]
MNNRNNNDKLKILKTSTIKYRLYKFGKDLVNGSNKTTGTKDVEQIAASDHTSSKLVLGALLSLGAVSTTVAATNSARADGDVKNKVKSSDKDSSTLANKDHSIIALTNSEDKTNSGIDVTPAKTILSTESFKTVDGKQIAADHPLNIDSKTGVMDMIYPPEYEGYYPNVTDSTFNILVDGSDVATPIDLPTIISLNELKNSKGEDVSNMSEFVTAVNAGGLHQFVSDASPDNAISISVVYSQGQFKWDKVKDLTYNSTDSKAVKPTVEDYINPNSIKEPDLKDTTDLTKLTMDDSKVNYKKAGVYDVDIQYVDKQMYDHHQTAHLTVTAGEFKWGSPKDQIYNSADPKAERPKAEDYIDVKSIKEPDGKAYDESKLKLDDSKVNYSKAGKYTVTITYTDDQGVEHTATATIQVLEAFSWDKPKNLTYDLADTNAKRPTVEDYIDVKSIKEPDGKAYDKSKLEFDESNVNYDKAGKYTVVIRYTDDQGEVHATTATLTITGEFEWGKPKNLTYDTTDPKAEKPTVEDYIDVNSIKEADGKAYDKDKLKLDDSKVDYTKGGTYQVTITYTDDQGEKHTATATITVIVKFSWDNPKNLTYDTTDTTAKKPTVEDYIDVNSIKEPDGKAYDKSKLEFDDHLVDYTKAGKYTIVIRYTDDKGEVHATTATLTVLEAFAWDNPTNQTYDKTDPNATRPTINDYIDVDSIKEPDGKAYDENKLIFDDDKVDYSKAGTYEVTITYTDDQGVKHTTKATITVVETYASNSNSLSSSLYDSTSASESKHISESNSEIISGSNESDSKFASTSKGNSESTSGLNSSSKSASDGAVSDSIANSESKSKEISDSDNSKSNDESNSAATSKSNSVSNPGSNDSRSASVSKSDSESTSTSNLKSDSDHSDSVSVSDSKSTSISNSSNESNSNFSDSASISASDSASSSISKSKSTNEDSKSASASTSDSTSTSLIKPNDPSASKNASNSTNESESISKLISNSDNEDSKLSVDSQNKSNSNSKLDSDGDVDASQSASNSKATSKDGSNSDSLSNLNASKSASISDLGSESLSKDISDSASTSKNDSESTSKIISDSNASDSNAASISKNVSNYIRAKFKLKISQ